ncbi:MAG: anaerobic ribonucleoside-triphosphate reductase [Oscillospiraceae bacterium]
MRSARTLPKTLLDNDIVEAHEQGIIHFHDADYLPSICTTTL